MTTTMTTINAFHPDYVKTYMPEFLTTLRTESSQHAHGVINGGKSKATRENNSGGRANTIEQFPKTDSVQRKLEKAQSAAALAERKRKMLDVTAFHVFSKAGASNVTPKGKKK